MLFKDLLEIIPVNSRIGVRLIDSGEIVDYHVCEFFHLYRRYDIQNFEVLKIQIDNINLRFIVDLKCIR